MKKTLLLILLSIIITLPTAAKPLGAVCGLNLNLGKDSLTLVNELKRNKVKFKLSKSESGNYVDIKSPKALASKYKVKYLRYIIDSNVVKNIIISFDDLSKDKWSNFFENSINACNCYFDNSDKVENDIIFAYDDCIFDFIVNEAAAFITEKPESLFNCK